MITIRDKIYAHCRKNTVVSETANITTIYLVIAINSSKYPLFMKLPFQSLKKLYNVLNRIKITTTI